MLGPGARGGEGDGDEAARSWTSRQRRWAVIGLGVVAGDADPGVEGVVDGLAPQRKALRRARRSDLPVAEVEARPDAWNGSRRRSARQESRSSVGVRTRRSRCLSALAVLAVAARSTTARLSARMPPGTILRFIVLAHPCLGGDGVSPHFGASWCRGLPPGLPMRRGSVPVDSRKASNTAVYARYRGPG